MAVAAGPRSGIGWRRCACWPHGELALHVHPVAFQQLPDREEIRSCCTGQPAPVWTIVFTDWITTADGSSPSISGITASLNGIKTPTRRMPNARIAVIGPAMSVRRELRTHEVQAERFVKVVVERGPKCHIADTTRGPLRIYTAPPANAPQNRRRGLARPTG